MPWSPYVEGLEHFPHGLIVLPVPKVWLYFRGDFKLKVYRDSILHGILARCCQSLDTHSRLDIRILSISEQNLSSNAELLSHRGAK